MFEKSAATQSIFTILKGVNGEVSYEVIVAATGLPLDKLRGALTSARRALEREKIVFATVRGVGLRRLGDGEKVRSTERIKASIRRSSKRGIRRLDAVDDVTALAGPDQISATINRTLFETIRSHTSPAQTARKADGHALPDLAALRPL